MKRPVIVAYYFQPASGPLVSIITCAYNAGKYLRESVASALVQTWEGQHP